MALISCFASIFAVLISFFDPSAKLGVFGMVDMVQVFALKVYAVHKLFQSLSHVF